MDAAHRTIERWRLLVVVAHPDDETFGCGSLIAHAVAAGAGVTVCCATRGEAGEVEPGCELRPGGLAATREAELREAAAILGVSAVEVLDFRDSGMAGPTGPDTLVGADPTTVVDAVAGVVRRVDPDVVVTLDPLGGDGHRDHVRIAEATTEAVRRSGIGASLYHWVLSRALLLEWLEHRASDLAVVGRDDDEVTTVLDVGAHVDVRRRAMDAHRSQRSPFADMPDDLVRRFLEVDRLVRAEPPWAGGPVERELTRRAHQPCGR